MTTRYEFALKGCRHLAKLHHFKAPGLPSVYLLNGVKLERDADYGELVTIDQLPDLSWPSPSPSPSSGPTVFL
jgi:hypothetical protein